MACNAHPLDRYGDMLGNLPVNQKPLHILCQHYKPCKIKMQAFTGKSYKFFRFFYSVIAIDGIYWKCSGICLLQMGPNFTFLSYSAGNIHAVVNNTDGVRYVATYLAKEIKDAVVFMITRFSQETRNPAHYGRP
jgi:hypothetical protein